MLPETICSYMLLAISPAIQAIFVLLITLTFSAVFYNFLYARSLKRESDFIKAHNNRLALILRSSNISVWVYNAKERKYAKLSADGETESEYTPIDFSRFYDAEDFEEMRQIIFDIRDKKKASYVMRLHTSQKDNEDRQMVELKLSVLTNDKQGNPELILGMQRPYTTERRRQNREQAEIIQYKTVFNSVLIDMTFFNEDGLLTDINQTACENFHVVDSQELIDGGCTIADTVGFDVDLNLKEPIRCTCMLDMDALAEEGRRGKGVQLGGKLYYEVMIYPIRYDSGEPLGLFMEGRNITEMVNSYHHQQETMRQLQQATSELRASIDNINMALKVAECRLMNYYPDKHELFITTDLDKPQYRLTQVRLLDVIDEADRANVKQQLMQMDRKQNKAMDIRFKTIFNTPGDSKMYVTFNAIPMYDADGTLTHYFGMGRNDTKLINTENELKAETLKAQETELLKDSFLLNMSYEIRTPLSSVLGFAELFETEHNAEDELVFVDEIKKNSNKLLNLVNDVLYISRIDANMIEVKRQPVDFALAFDSHCHMGWSTNTKPDLKTIVENPYEHLEVIIDPELTGNIIETLVHNAITFTETGSVRAKYEYRSGELNITVEDTGFGISSEDLPHLFDRFGHNREPDYGGTGLNMAIVKGLVELQNGKIDVISAPGKGTTVWVSIPCELVNMDMKKNFTA
ncbi:MAG: PAS domain-containing sensor histidine kinase [Prevotella sp.]|nr:PAS domain-containing sensor histidine kinase [Prevotella sp.]